MLNIDDVSERVQDSTPTPDRMAQTMLPAVIARHAMLTPDAPFLQEVDGPSATYGEVHNRAMRWMAALAAAGISAGDRVVTMLPTGIDAVAIWLGLAWLRAIDVATNPDYRGDVLDAALKLIEPSAIIALPDRLGDLAATPAVQAVDRLIVPSAPDGLPVSLRGKVDDFATFLAQASDTPITDPAPPQPWDIACIIFTSGTTGPSKGVLIPWGMLDAAARSAFPLEEVLADEVYYCALPFYHLLGRHCVAQMALTGRRLVTRKRYSVTEFWSDVRRYGATMAFAFTAPLYQQPPRNDDTDHTLRTLFAVPMIPEHREFDLRFGVRTRTMFGMTELGVAFASGAHVDDYRACGRAVAGPAGLEVRLVDEHDIEVSVGQIGELVARTRHPWALNAGYFRMPEETAYAWRNGWFHTGDGFRRDEHGNYYFVERLKDYIRRRGENISAYEVEAAANRYPDVLESAAIAVPSDTGEDEVKICIVAVAGRNPTADDIWAHLQESLPKYMVPRYVEFLAALPRTVTMKVRKVDLRADALNRRTKDRLAQREGTTTS